MKTRCFPAGIVCVLAILACSPAANTALAQSSSAPKVQNPKAMYAIMPTRLRTDVALAPAAAAVVLPTWNGSFTYQGTGYTYNMVGAAPSTNTSTTISRIIIPVKF